MSLTTLIARASSALFLHQFNMKNFLHTARFFLPTVAALFAGTSNAQITTNGDFESGSFNGWSQAGVIDIASGTGYFSGFGPFQSGHFAVAFGAGNGPATGVLQQSVDTIVGQAYELAFDYGKFQTLDSGSGSQSIGVAIVDTNSLQTLLTDTVVDASGSNIPSSLFSPYAYRFVAIGARTTISFSDLSTFTFSTDGLLDNVAISAVPVPEPGSWALMAAGLAGLYRRKSARGN